MYILIRNRRVDIRDRGLRHYLSKAGWYSVSYPSFWTVEESEECVTFSDPVNGVGVLQFSAYQTPSHQNCKDILLEYLSDNGISAEDGNIANEEKAGRCVASCSYEQGSRFKRIWFMSCGCRLLMITYICDVGEQEKENREVERIVGSAKIEPDVDKHQM